MPANHDALKEPIESGVASSANALFKQRFYFNRPDHIITLHPFTITNVNCTPALANVGGRPCVSLAGAGAATDGSNFCFATAAHMLVAGKRTRLFFSVRSADATNHEWCVGIGTVTTTAMANLSGGTPSANFVYLRKLKTELIPKVISRKASGIAEIASCNLTQADATWYDFEVVIDMDPTTAGYGRVRVFCRTNGGSPVLVLDTNLGALPDTVVTALVFGFLEGDTGTDATVVNEVSIEQEL